jgi:hypothetical protein
MHKTLGDIFELGGVMKAGTFNVIARPAIAGPLLRTPRNDIF